MEGSLSYFDPNPLYMVMAPSHGKVKLQSCVHQIEYKLTCSHSPLPWNPDITMYQRTGKITSLYRGIVINESPV